MPIATFVLGAVLGAALAPGGFSRGSMLHLFLHPPIYVIAGTQGGARHILTLLANSLSSKRSKARDARF